MQILTVEEERQYGLERGAFSFINKPLTTDGLEAAFDRIKHFTAAARAPAAGGRGRSGRAAEHPRAARVTTISRSPPPAPAREALALLRERSFDCIVLDLRLPDMSGFELLDAMQQDARAARHADRGVHRPRTSEEEAAELRKRKAKSIVLKGVHSPERLLDETALFLHRVIADLPPAKQQMIETLHQSDEPLRGTQGAGGR